MKSRTTFWKLLRPVLLVGTLAALLGFYLLTVRNLPLQIYTEAQQEFLAYNRMRSIQQIAPTLSFKVGDEVWEEEGLASPILSLPWNKSDIHAELKARFEEQGGVSAAVYDLTFRGVYLLEHTGEMTTTVDVTFPFPSNLDTLHEVNFLVNGEEPALAVYTTGAITWQTDMAPGDSFEVEISYRAEGATSFTYGLVHNQRTDVNLVVDVTGLTGSTVPQYTLPASTMESTGEGEQWVWRYDGLIADRDIRLDLPERLNFAQKIAAQQAQYRTLGAAAPWLVGITLCAMGLVFRNQQVRLRLESYLLIGLGLALYFPLLTFLSAALPQVVAVVIAFCLIAALVVRFVRIATDSRPMMWQAVLLLVVFLGFFALGLLTPWRGLFFTTGGLVLVGLFMLLSAHKAAIPAPPPPDETAKDASNDDMPEQPERDPAEVANDKVDICAATPAPEAAPAQAHCPYCGRELAQDFDFCPGCGRGTGETMVCQHCGALQVMPDGAGTRYCVQCGAKIGM